MGRLDSRNRYVPVRLGDVNTQTRWVLERSGAREPEFLAHVMLRVQDVMREDFPQAPESEPVREVGLLMSHHDMDLVPIVDEDGALAGVLTERALARRYIRESREPSELDAAATVGAIARVVEGDAAQRLGGRRGVRPDLVHGDGHRRAADARSAPATSRSSATATTRSAPRSSWASACSWSPTARSPARRR